MKIFILGNRKCCLRAATHFTNCSAAPTFCNKDCSCSTSAYYLPWDFCSRLRAGSQLWNLRRWCTSHLVRNVLNKSHFWIYSVDQLMGKFIRASYTFRRSQQKLYIVLRRVCFPLFSASTLKFIPVNFQRTFTTGMYRARKRKYSSRTVASWTILLTLRRCDRLVKPWRKLRLSTSQGWRNRPRR